MAEIISDKIKKKIEEDIKACIKKFHSDEYLRLFKDCKSYKTFLKNCYAKHLSECICKKLKGRIHSFSREKVKNAKDCIALHKELNTLLKKTWEEHQDELKGVILKDCLQDILCDCLSKHLWNK